MRANKHPHLEQALTAACAFFAVAATEVSEQPGISWSAPVDIASGPGQRGEWRQNESDWDYVDDPTVALQENGAAAVAWVDQKRKDVLFQIYERDGKPRLKEPVNVSRTPAVFSWLPRIALAPDRPGDIYILWQEIVFSGGSHGGDIFFARSQDGGATFTEPLNLSKSVGGDGKGRITASNWDNGSLDLAVTARGGICAAWTEYHGSLWFSRSDDRGATFTKPTRVSGDDDRPARAPALALDGDATIYLAWTTGEDLRADIRVARSDDRGQRFGAPTMVARTSDYSDAPKLAVGAGEKLHVVFGERAAGGWRKADIHYTHSSDGGRTFAPRRIVSEPHPAGARLAAFPSLSLDRIGNIFVTWEIYRGGNSGGKGLAVASSADAGATFSAPAVIPGSVDPEGGANGSNQGKLMRRLAVNDGVIAIANSSLKHGAKSRVWLIRGALDRH